MSLRWDISNKVQVLKGWVRQLFGRLTGDRRQRSRARAIRSQAI